MVVILLVVIAVAALSFWSIYIFFWRYAPEKKFFALKHLLIQSAVACFMGFGTFVMALGANGHSVPSDLDEMLYEVFFYISLPAFCSSFVAALAITVRQIILFVKLRRS